MASEEQAIIKEREKLKSAIAGTKNLNEREKLLEEDLQLRDKLAARYASQDPVHAQRRAQAHRAMENFQRYGNTQGRR